MRREGRPAARLFAALGGVGGCDGRRLFVGARAGGSRWRGCRERLIGAGAGAANCAAVGSAAPARCARGGAAKALYVWFLANAPSQKCTQHQLYSQ